MFELPIQQYQRAAPQPDQRLPLAAANAPSSHSSSRCTALPEAFDALPSFTKEIANDYSPRQAVLALARHVAIGGRDTRPTLPIPSFEWPAITDAQLLLLTSGRMYHAELIRENTTYQFFPASAVCCPGHLAHFGRRRTARFRFWRSTTIFTRACCRMSYERGTATGSASSLMDSSSM